MVPFRTSGFRRLLALLALFGVASPVCSQTPAVTPSVPATTIAPVKLPGLATWSGDLDGLLKRRTFRLLVPYSKTLYFIDRGRQMGVVAEFGQALEDWLNKKYGAKHLRQHVVFVPTPRDELFDALNAGKGDAIAANLTITPERQALADFTTPWLRDVKEIIVTGPASPAIATVDELSGKTVHVRSSSSYATHLEALNKQFVAKGKPLLLIKPLSDDLEDEDILEMVSAGLLPFAVVDDHKAQVWAQIFPKLVSRPDLAINTGGEVAWAIRKGSPLLKAELNAFFTQHQSGTSFGNTIRRRYFGGVKAVRSAVSDSEVKKFTELIALFQKHGGTVNFEPLMLAAQGYQESHLDQSRRSQRGAVGVMQLLPSTASAPPISIQGVERDADTNIRAGATYMRYLMDQYVNDPQLTPRNRMLMTFAAYNAGPGNLRKFRREAKAQGLNPDIWFNNVEQGAAKVVGRETVQYVSNIYKYFIAYELATERIQETALARKAMAPAK